MSSIAVKAGAGEQKKGLGRHLEGWQLGALALFIAGTVAVLTVPRPVDPVELPDPRADAFALARTARVDAELARQAEGDRLDLDVRELGAAVRAYGAAEAEGNEDAAVHERDRAARATARALAVGVNPVLQLRAYQLRAFLGGIRTWEGTGQITDDLRELGGGFLRMLRRNGWMEDVEGARRVKMSEAAVAASFKKRWSEITTLKNPPFDVSIDEERALFGFLLKHPIALSPFAFEDLPPAAAAAQRRNYEEQFRLKKVEELAAVDPRYPKDLARGVVLYRLRRYPLAVEAFRRHLEASPDGPYTLRAQNYLRAALGRARE